MNGYEKQTGLEPWGLEVVGDKMQICAPYLLVIPLEGGKAVFSSTVYRLEWGAKCCSRRVLETKVG